MSNAYPLGGDHLLNDTCTLASYTSTTYTADTGDDAESFATAATLACMVSPTLSYRWGLGWPNVDLSRSIEVWLPSTTTVKPQDKLTYASLAYRIVATVPAVGIALMCLAERIEGVTA